MAEAVNQDEPSSGSTSFIAPPRPLAGQARCLAHLEAEPCSTCAAYIAAGL